jgi:hypothetical protein
VCHAPEGVAPARNCTEPVWIGEPCDEPSDCYSLLCNSEKAVCVASAAEVGENDELEPDFPGIIGSVTSDQVNNGGGTVDVSAGGTGGSGGEQFSAATTVTQCLGMMGLFGAAITTLVSVSLY